MAVVVVVVIVVEVVVGRRRQRRRRRGAACARAIFPATTNANIPFISRPNILATVCPQDDRQSVSVAGKDLPPRSTTVYYRMLALLEMFFLFVFCEQPGCECDGIGVVRLGTLDPVYGVVCVCVSVWVRLVGAGALEGKTGNGTALGRFFAGGRCDGAIKSACAPRWWLWRWPGREGYNGYTEYSTEASNHTRTQTEHRVAAGAEAAEAATRRECLAAQCWPCVCAECVGWVASVGGDDGRPATR